MGEFQQKRKHARCAASIPIDPDKMRGVLRRRFITNPEAGELIGRSRGWMSVILHKRKINFYRLDDLAGVLNMTFEDLFEKVVDEDEWLNG